MTEKILDCRGLACPNPVLKTKELADQGVASFTVLVDNAAVKENVSRFLSRAGFEVNVTQEGGAFAVSGTRAAGACEVMAEKVPEQTQKIPPRQRRAGAAPARTHRGPRTASCRGCP